MKSSVVSESTNLWNSIALSRLDYIPQATPQINTLKCFSLLGFQGQRTSYKVLQRYGGRYNKRRSDDPH